jgi:hypothetical protein
MSKKPTKKDLEVKLKQKDNQLQELENTIADMVKMREHIGKDMQDRLSRMGNQQKSQALEIEEHKRQQEKAKENMLLWKSAYYDLKDRTVDLEHRMDAVREMITENMVDLPEGTEEKEKAVDSALSRVLRYVVKLENKVFIKATDAIEHSLSKWTNGNRFKQLWNFISPSAFS